MPQCAARFTFFILATLLFVSKQCHAQEPLRAGTIFSATQAPLWSAKEGRYFEKYGIKNLEVIQFSGGQPVTRALDRRRHSDQHHRRRRRSQRPAERRRHRHHRAEPSACFPTRSTSAKIFATHLN